MKDMKSPFLSLQLLGNDTSQLGGFCHIDKGIPLRSHIFFPHRTEFGSLDIHQLKK